MRTICALTMLVGFAVATSGHHSFGAEYDGNKPITLSGEVTKVEWTNPHSHFFLDVTRNGKTENWKFEGYPPNVLYRTGWKRAVTMKEGDKITVVAPGGQVTPAGVMPRLKQFVVIGTLESGHYEYDSSLALIHLEDAARLFRLDGAAGVQLRLKDPQQARRVAQELVGVLPANLTIRDWTRTNRNWFDAVQIEKRMMFIILTLIVAVAAFNLVSTLVMTVTDKRADIAILRTLGASPGSIMGIFVVQGALAGIIGTQFFTIAGADGKPMFDQATRDIFALLAFAAGFIVRPFGAMEKNIVEGVY